MKPSKTRLPQPNLEKETPLRPHAVASGVWQEARVWLGEDLPREWVAKLSAKARTLYRRNPQVRRALRGSGNAGRDWLWAFTRHWLCALIRSHRPDWHARLPGEYNVGRALSDRTNKTEGSIPVKSRRRDDESEVAADDAWAAAAHFY